MSGHTPGPWETGGESDLTAILAPSCGYVKVAEANDAIGDGEANARLIAAAPELLEALLDARKQLESYEEALNGEDYNSPRINAAIAKATQP